MTKDDLEELREKTQNTDRVTTATEESSRPPLAEEIVEQKRAVADGKNPSIGTRSDSLAALLYALAERGELEDVNEALLDDLEGEPDVELDSKSGLVELGIRLALQEGASEYFEALGDANAEYARKYS